MVAQNDTTMRIVDLLLRYVHDEPYAEPELGSVMATLSTLDAAELRAIENLFVDHHVEYARTLCMSEFAKTEPPRQPLDSLGEILRLWSTVVMPPQLGPILTPEGLETVRRAFSAIVRDTVDLAPSLQALAESDSLSDHTRELRTMSEAGLDEAVNTVLAQCIPREIRKFVESHFARRYDAEVYSQIEHWLQGELTGNIEVILQPLNGHKSIVPKATVQNLAWEALARLRINELYHIISTANMDGIEDLRRTLTTPELRNAAVEVFSKQCQELLLNGGADTVEIINMYLQTIKGFSILDPRGVLLERVSEPIQKVLKERADTSAVVSEGLFGLPSSPLGFLSDELGEQPHAYSVPKGCSGFYDWHPDPIDAPIDFVKKQTDDRVATLINLYDNKEVFVKQFGSLYSNELLNASFDSSSEKTLSRLEQHCAQLAQRFGESHLQKIGVMLSDMHYSHKTAALIHDRHPALANVSGVVLSRLYWPALNASSGPPLQLPPVMNERIKEYAQVYQNLEGHESLALEWLPNRGRVSLEIELEDRKLDLVVEPEQAILITAFENAATESLSLNDLLELTQLEEPVLLAALQFWVSQGVVGTNGEEYKILETIDEAQAQTKSQTQVVTSTVLGSSTTSKKNLGDAFEDMQVYWSYIKGMLTNLGALPLEKIHSFLVLFVPNEDPYVKTKQELESYLLAMVDEEKLQLDDGKFRLFKK